MASAGALIAELYAETASFRHDMGKAVGILNSSAAKMNRSLSSIEQGFYRLGSSVAAALSVGAIAAYSKSIIDAGNEFSKLSQRSGVSVEKLSEFAHGAKLANVSTQDMTTGLQKLAQNMAEAVNNRGSQAASVFNALGISVTDVNGNLRDTSQVFEELSGKFAGAADGAEKVAIARALLGKTGDSLIPMMNQLAQTSEEARRLGLIVSGEFAKNAERFNDSLSLMGGRLASFMRKSLTPYIEMMNRFFGAFSDDLSGLQQRRMETMVEMQRMMNEGVPKSHPQIQALIKQIDDLDTKIIAANQKLLATTNPPGGKKKLPLVETQGQSDAVKRLLGDLEAATMKSNAAIILDDRRRAEESLEVEKKKWRTKIDLTQAGTKQRQEIEEKYQAWLVGATNEMNFNLRTPMEKLNEEWQNTTQQMQKATAGWAQSTTNTIDDVVFEGKGSFSDLADSVIRDLRRMWIQKSITGPLFTSMESGGIFSGIGSLLGLASGGNPPVGVPSLVGERGPELFVPRTAGMIVPNNALGGAPAVTVNVINESGTPMQAQSRGGRFEADTWVVDVVMRQIEGYGPLRTAIALLK